MKMGGRGIPSRDHTRLDAATSRFDYASVFADNSCQVLRPGKEPRIVVFRPLDLRAQLLPYLSRRDTCGLKHLLECHPFGNFDRFKFLPADIPLGGGDALDAHCGHQPLVRLGQAPNPFDCVGHADPT